MYGTDWSMIESRSPNLNWLRRLRRALGSERGSNLIEMSVIATFVFMLLGGIVDFGSAYSQYIIITNASREGARQYSHLPCKSDNRSGVKSTVVGAALSESTGLVTAKDITLSPDPTSICPAAGGAVAVTVDVTYHPQFASLLGLNQIPLQARTSMVFYGNDLPPGVN